MKQSHLFFSFLPCLFLFSLTGCGGETTPPKIEFEAKETSVEDYTLNYYENRKGYMIEDYRGKLDSIILPSEYKGEPIVAIGPYAFATRKMRTVVLSDSILRLEDYAFLNSEVENLVVTEHLDSFSSKAFDGSGVKTYEKDSVIYLPTMEAMYGYAVRFNQKSRSITLPNGCVGLINGATDNLWKGNVPEKERIKLTLPSSIRVIHYNQGIDWSFSSDVKSLTLNYCGGTGATFYRNTSITSLHLGFKAAGIPDRCFYSWSALETVTFEEGCTKIGGYAFSGCSKLKEVILPNSCERVENDAFRGCSALKTLRIPNVINPLIEAFTSLDNKWGSDDTHNYGIEKIIAGGNIPELGLSMYSDYSHYFYSLKEIVIEEGCQTIGARAFRMDRDLETLTLPKSLKSIGESAFQNTLSLKKIVYGGTSAEWEAIEGLAQAEIPEGVTIQYTVS